MAIGGGTNDTGGYRDGNDGADTGSAERGSSDEDVGGGTVNARTRDGGSSGGIGAAIDATEM